MERVACIVPGSGKQGQAAARALLERGYKVHALVRNALSDTARRLQDLGVILHVGDLDDTPSIEKALEGVDSIFVSIPAHPTNELSYAGNIIDAAKKQGVTSIVYTSVARTGDHESFPGWNEEYPLGWYWKNKKVIEDMVRDAAFPQWTILRPAFFTQNFCQPTAQHLFPDLVEKQELSLAYEPETRLDLIDIEDIASWAAAALDKPDVFSKQEISLAAEKLTATEIAQVLEQAAGKKVTVNYIDDENANLLVQEGRRDILAQIWHRNVGYNVDLDVLRQYDLPLTSFKDAMKRDALGW